MARKSKDTPHSEDVLMQFLQEVRDLQGDYGLVARGGSAPDNSDSLELGWSRPDGTGVHLVLVPKAHREGPLTIVIGRFEGTGTQRRQAVQRWFEDW